MLDLGPPSDGAVLLLTGWTDYAFSSDNVAASQSRPRHGAAVAAGEGRARAPGGRSIEEIGFPVGRPQTVVVNLAGKFLSAAREVRIVTNMRIYWDQVLVAASDGAVAIPDDAPRPGRRRSPLARVLGRDDAGRPGAVRLRLSARVDGGRRGK